ncbi:hypothetical protein I6G37_07770 [Serratia rubidaea]|nr:hypothetical protein I6G37_07770 [Serratia rubidaea]
MSINTSLIGVDVRIIFFVATVGNGALPTVARDANTPPAAPLVKIFLNQLVN